MLELANNMFDFFGDFRAVEDNIKGAVKLTLAHKMVISWVLEIDP